MNEQEIKVVDAMEKYGGSFVKCLAKCFYHADPNNLRILKTAFSHYWQEYEKMAGYQAENERLIDEKINHEIDQNLREDAEEMAQYE